MCLSVCVCVRVSVSVYVSVVVSHLANVSCRYRCLFLLSTSKSCRTDQATQTDRQTDTHTELLSVRLPSNLRQTTRKCVYLVKLGHFRSLDKDGGHTIPSVKAENSLSSTEPSSCRSKFYIAKIGIFAVFCCCVFDLDPMTLTFERDP